MHGRGYHAVGVAEIAEGAEAPKGSFYAQFPTKDEFAVAVVDAFAKDVFGILVLHLEGEGTPLERLRAYFEARIRHYRKNGCARGCLLGNFGLELGDDSPAVRDAVAEALARYAAHLQKTIAKGQATGEIRSDRSAAFLARQLVRAWEGALLAMRVEKSVTPLREFVTASIDDALVRG